MLEYDWTLFDKYYIKYYRSDFGVLTHIKWHVNMWLVTVIGLL